MKKRRCREPLCRETLPHPNGIQPLGNGLLSNSRSAKKSMGYFAFLSDELILEFLTHLEPEETSRLSQSCQGWYCFGVHDDVWRTYTLARFGGKFNFDISWRNTFIQSSGYPSVVSLIVRNMYSDLLYSYWNCTTMPLESLGSRNKIDRISKHSTEDIIKNYMVPNRPVILTDVVPSWPAYTKWTRSYLLEKCEQRLLKAECVEMSLGDYFNYMDKCYEESPLYLFDNGFANQSGLDLDYKVPECFNQDLFQILENRPDYRWLIIGPARSGSTFHLDPNCTSAWNAVLSGRKKWILFPPHQIPPGVHPSPDGSEVTSPVSVTEWYINHYHEVQALPLSQKPIECICEAGEMIFVPSGWWHCVINLEPSIAITQNFVSRENLVKVLGFLRDKKDQVSGWHQSSDLYTEFTAKLSQLDANLLSDFENLESTPQEPVTVLSQKDLWNNLTSSESTYSFAF